MGDPQKRPAVGAAALNPNVPEWHDIWLALVSIQDRSSAFDRIKSYFLSIGRKNKTKKCKGQPANVRCKRWIFMYQLIATLEFQTFAFVTFWWTWCITRKHLNMLNKHITTKYHNVGICGCFSSPKWCWRSPSASERDAEACGLSKMYTWQHHYWTWRMLEQYMKFKYDNRRRLGSHTIWGHFGSKAG